MERAGFTADRSNEIVGVPKSAMRFWGAAWQGWNTVAYNGNLGYAAEAYIES
ncbi:hypothetical protein JQM63_05545 [Oscillibacter valericigenes]|nr:hypothetical protein [Oscillibacter valericigenes]